MFDVTFSDAPKEKDSDGEEEKEKKKKEGKKSSEEKRSKCDEMLAKREKERSLPEGTGNGEAPCIVIISFSAALPLKVDRPFPQRAALHLQNTTVSQASQNKHFSSH